MITFLFLIFLFLVNISSCLGQTSVTENNASNTKESLAAATNALATLQKMATDEKSRSLGFSGPGEATNSELETPLTDYMIRLDSLREFSPSTDPISLLNPTGLVIYPVKIGEAVRSSITLRKVGASWDAAAFGAPVTSNALVTTRQRVVAGQPGGAAEAFQVRIPALNLIFVGNFVNGMLTLTSIMDVPMYGITANSPSDARELLAKLKPMAQQHNGLPR